MIRCEIAGVCLFDCLDYELHSAYGLTCRRTEEDKKLKRAIAQTFYKMAVGQGKEGERTEKSEKSEKKQKLNTKGAEFVVKVDFDLSSSFCC